MFQPGSAVTAVHQARGRRWGTHAGCHKPGTPPNRYRSGTHVSADTTRPVTGQRQSVRQLALAGRTWTYRRPNRGGRHAPVVSVCCRVYSGRSAGGHVPAIYYYNTHTDTHQHTAQHVTTKLTG